MNMEMTNKEYVETKGLQCPVCRDKDISLYDECYETGYVLGYLQCRICNISWVEEHTLSSYKLDEPDNQRGLL